MTDDQKYEEFKLLQPQITNIAAQFFMQPDEVLALAWEQFHYLSEKYEPGPVPYRRYINSYFGKRLRRAIGKEFIWDKEGVRCFLHGDLDYQYPTYETPQENTRIRELMSEVDKALDTWVANTPKPGGKRYDQRKARRQLASDLFRVRINNIKQSEDRFDEQRRMYLEMFPNSKNVNRHINSMISRAREVVVKALGRPTMTRRWTEAEIDMLRSVSGNTPLPRVAELLDRSIPSIRHKIRNLDLPICPQIHQDASSEPPNDSARESITFSEKPDTGEASGLLRVRERITTPEEVMARLGVNPLEWVVTSITAKGYEGFVKTEEGHEVVPMWSIKVQLKQKTCWNSQEFIDHLKSELARPPVKVKKQPKALNENLLAEISIMDHHFGKLSWAPETGEDYDLAIAEERFRAASKAMIRHCVKNKPGRILIVIGNDLYHVDKGDNTTTRGTKVDADGRWQKAFCLAILCNRDLIDELVKLGFEIDLVIVPGNHDQEKLFCAGEVFSALYENNPQVSIDNSPNPVKTYLWGRTFLGFAHYEECVGTKKEKDAIDRLAALNPEAWANSTWREVHAGHLHSEREEVWYYRKSEEQQMCIFRRLPSLCGTDFWHYQKGYKSFKAAECHFYDREAGKVGMFTDTLHSLEI